MMRVGFYFVSISFGVAIFIQHRIHTPGTNLRGILGPSPRLDMGCGKGQACVDVARQSGAAVTGVDLSTSNIQRAKEFLAMSMWGFPKLRGYPKSSKSWMTIFVVKSMFWWIPHFFRNHHVGKPCKVKNLKPPLGLVAPHKWK